MAGKGGCLAEQKGKTWAISLARQLCVCTIRNSHTSQSRVGRIAASLLLLPSDGSPDKVESHLRHS